jgi:chloramphenicol-sensitive protein RarD
VLQSTSPPPRVSARAGVLYGVAAYVWWGLVPLYFKLVKDVRPIDVLAHRVVWSVLFLIVLVFAQRQWDDVRRCFRSPQLLFVLAGSTTALAINWLTFIYAVAHGYVLEASLGYFITPLLNVLSGMIFLKERLRAGQAIGLALATAAVVNMTLFAGALPWIAVVLAISFSTYGLLRKTMPVGPLVGTMVETTLLLPLGTAFVAAQFARDVAAGAVHLRIYGPLLCAGLVTAIPLLWFAAASRRLRLATLGFLQYIGPTGQFLLAVFAFAEPLRPYRLISFAMIWLALAIYSWDSWLAYDGVGASSMAQPPPAVIPIPIKAEGGCAT